MDENNEHDQTGRQRLRSAKLDLLNLKFKIFVIQIFLFYKKHIIFK